jgi:hypothetical protein
MCSSQSVICFLERFSFNPLTVSFLPCFCNKHFLHIASTRLAVIHYQPPTSSLGLSHFLLTHDTILPII